MRTALVASEVALALVLVSGAALLLKSFVNLVNLDAGFARGGVAVLQVFAWDRNPGPRSAARVLRRRARTHRGAARASRPPAR